MRTYLASLIAISVSTALPLAANETKNVNTDIIEKIVVKGELLPTTANGAANSIDVINQEALEKNGAEHIQDVLQQVGNVNYASGSSRARFFQIRGIGERSQFTDPVNPSVGVAIDGIDYSEMANAATLFDIDQVEIFKGPQGTSVGANAMAGFINLTSTETGSSQSNKLRISAGNYGFTQLAAAYGGDISNDVAYRVSANKVDGNGYIDNVFLNKKDTNGIDELSLRAMVDAEVNRDWSVKAVVHLFDIDNGYDAFSLDLNRTTLSDQPGFDKQATSSFAMTNTYTGLEIVDLDLFVSTTTSDLDYGYDEDWAYTLLHDEGYTSTDHYFRNRDANQVDFKVTSKQKDWVVGLYNQQKNTDLTRVYTYNSANFMSEYKVNNVAVYAEKRFALSPSINISTGLRIENYNGDYIDNNGTDRSTEDTMWGGHFTASKQYDSSFMSYFRLSRGFKAGGVNGEALSKLKDDALQDFYYELREHASFAPEVLSNVELGLKYNSRNNKLSASATLFYSSREDMQIKQWLTDNKEVPVFVGYLSNVPTGANYGFETSVNLQVTHSLSAFAGISVLETEVDNISRLETDPTTWLETQVNISGREQAHAPNYQFSLGADWTIFENLVANVSITGKDEFYYSYSHDEQAEQVTLTNASLTYKGDNIDIKLWVRNVTDEEYGVRGFYFGNDPRDGYTAKNYEQYGEPMVLGVQFDYLF